MVNQALRFFVSSGPPGCLLSFMTGWFGTTSNNIKFWRRHCDLLWTGGLVQLTYLCSAACPCWDPFHTTENFPGQQLDRSRQVRTIVVHVDRHNPGRSQESYPWPLVFTATSTTCTCTWFKYKYLVGLLILTVLPEHVSNWGQPNLGGGPARLTGLSQCWTMFLGRQVRD
jgi:hypothetical protein